MLCFGSRRGAWRKYIASCLRAPGSIDTRLLFVAFAGVSPQKLRWIKAEVEKHAHFDEIIFKKTAPSVAVNCGPGSFGLLFWRKEA